MLAQDEVIKTTQAISTISTLDLNRAIDSIFIVQALLIAIVNDYPTSIETDEAVKKLTQEITLLENTEGVTDIKFSYIDNQFYDALSNAKGFQRLAAIISKEKLHIDRIIRLFVRKQESYKAIITTYKNVLHGIQLNNATIASNALFDLAEILKEHTFAAEKYYPEFFKIKTANSNFI